MSGFWGTAVWTGGHPRGTCGEGGTTGADDLLSVKTLAPPLGLLAGPLLPAPAGRRAASFVARLLCATCSAVRRYARRSCENVQLRYSSTKD
jgi:hypothetical protein